MSINSHRQQFILTYFSILTLFAVCLAGCWNQKDNKNPDGGSSGPASSGETNTANTTTTDQYKPKPFLEGWEKPEALLVLTGEQHGYLEPCGCSLTQSGGVSRRGDMFKQISDRNWEFLSFDLGGMVKRSRRQDKIKFEAIRQALITLGYKTAALGVEDLALETDYLFSLVATDAGQPNAKMPYLSANIDFYEEADLPTPSRYLVYEVNGIKVGVTAIFGNDYVKKLYGDNDPPAGQIKIVSPEEGIKRVLPEIEKTKPDVLLLLSHAKEAETKAILEKFPQFNIALHAGGIEDPHITSQPELVGKTQLWEVGYKGKKVGLVGIYKEKDGEHKFKFELVDLDKDRFGKTQSMEDIMAFYQDRLKEENLVETETALPDPDDSTYVGAKVCGNCHKKAYLKWRSSKHSHAFDSLKKGRKGTKPEEWVSRIYDPECLSCHVTGWDPQEYLRYESGYLNETVSAHLKGNQCENCHTAGSKHVELELAWKKNPKQTPELLAERKKMHLEFATAEQKVCIKCHDPDNSPGFNFKKYWEEVKHPFRD